MTNLKFIFSCKKAQGATEFMVTFGAVLLFFILFFGAVQLNISQKNNEKEMVLLQSIALGVKEEIELANEASEGYIRDFKTPLNILGKDYELRTAEGHVYAATAKNGISYKIPDFVGVINQGDNTIKKENGIVYLN